MVAKHDANRAKRDWPELQAFVEAITHELVTTTSTRDAPIQEASFQAALKHDVEKIFRTKKQKQNKKHTECVAERLMQNSVDKSLCVHAFIVMNPAIQNTS